MSVIVLDSAILIDVLRGYDPAVDFLRRLEAVPVCSEITRVEVLRGMRSNERPAVETLFQALDWIPIDELIARREGPLPRPGAPDLPPARTPGASGSQRSPTGHRDAKTGPAGRRR